MRPAGRAHLGEQPNKIERGFHTVGLERWRVQSVDANGTVQLQRADSDSEVQRVRGEEKSFLTLSAEELQKYGGLGIKKDGESLREGDLLMILRTPQGDIQTVELETTRDADGAQGAERVEQPETVKDAPR